MRNIREVKVGDFVRDNLGVEYRVQEVLPNSFAIAGRPTMLRRLEWVEKGFAEEQGWEMPLNVPKEAGVDDSDDIRKITPTGNGTRSLTQEEFEELSKSTMVKVDDSEEVGELTHDEIESIIDMIRYTNNNRLGMVDMGYWNTIISKLFDLLDNRINEKRNKK